MQRDAERGDLKSAAEAERRGEHRLARADALEPARRTTAADSPRKTMAMLKTQPIVLSFQSVGRGVGRCRPASRAAD